MVNKNGFGDIVLEVVGLRFVGNFLGCVGGSIIGK